jgi:Ca2+-binding EF-hand superfamily protein
MIIKHKLLASAAMVGVMLVAGTAAAQQQYQDNSRARHHSRNVAKADSNHDRALSKDEVVAAETRRFDRLDVNHDGQVDKSEFNKAHKKQNSQRRDAAFNRVDVNHDGVVSKDEWLAGVEKRFAAHDRNSDNKVSGEDRRGQKRVHHRSRNVDSQKSE